VHLLWAPTIVRSYCSAAQHLIDSRQAIADFPCRRRQVEKRLQRRELP
jgi:hypothetical protein